jgi:single-strand DNA-binding protein
MNDLNRVTLIGYLGKKPDVRYTTEGQAVANFTLAMNSSYKDKSEETKETTEWQNIVFFNRLAEVCKEFLDKGSRVYLEGKLRTRKWQDKNGVDRYTTDIVGSELKMLDSRASQQVNGEQYTQATTAAPVPESGDTISPDMH